jgi:formylglycine-generating enzyme required for sulfatase activity
VNGQQQTFTIIRGPVEFRMGSPQTEADRESAEKPHRRVIGRSFAIATLAVTIAEWQRFVKDHPKLSHEFPRRYSPDPGGPIINVSWFMAAQYCNWLSEKEGIKPAQWCYPRKIDEAMKPYPDHLRRTGYRLPTEAEWEYACRANTLSSRFYGCSQELLGRYTWYETNSKARTWPVGQKRPNDFGLFDMYGNVWNWCQEPFADYPGEVSVEDRENTNDVKNADRVTRGNMFNSDAWRIRSAYRENSSPDSGGMGDSFRVARTLP